MKVKSGTTIDEYLVRLDPARRAIAVELRTLINKTVPKAEETISWGSPWWKLNGLLCTVYTAGDHINFGFAHGAELDDPDGLLEGSGKGMRHVKLWDVSDIKKAKFAALIKQAAALNHESRKAAR